VLDIHANTMREEHFETRKVLDVRENDAHWRQTERESVRRVSAMALG
jgi:hypothetical protein